MQKILLTFVGLAIAMAVSAGPLDFYSTPFAIYAAPSSEGVTKLLVGSTQGGSKFIYTYDSQLRPQYSYITVSNENTVDSILRTAYTWCDNGLCATYDVTYNSQSNKYTYDQYGRVTEWISSTAGYGSSKHQIEYNEYGSQTKYILINDRIEIGGVVTGTRTDYTYSVPEKGQMGTMIRYNYQNGNWAYESKTVYESTQNDDILTAKILNYSYTPGSTDDDWTLMSYTTNKVQIINNVEYILSSVQTDIDADGKTTDTELRKGTIEGYTGEFSPFTHTIEQYGTKTITSYECFVNDDNEHVYRSVFSEYLVDGKKTNEYIDVYYPNGLRKSTASYRYNVDGERTSGSTGEYDELGRSIVSCSYGLTNGKYGLTSKTEREYYENSKAKTSELNYRTQDGELKIYYTETNTYDYSVPSEQVISYTELNGIADSYMLLENSLEYAGGTPLVTTYTYADAIPQSGIETVGVDEVDNSSTVEYFDLWGRKINTPSTPGIYLRRQGSATTKEVR